jgi:hypothetical protein
MCGKEPRDLVGLACLSETCINRWYDLPSSKRTQLELDFAAGTLDLKQFIQKSPRTRKCLDCEVGKAEYPKQMPNYCKIHRVCGFCLKKDRRPILRGAFEMDICCNSEGCEIKFAKMSSDDRQHAEEQHSKETRVLQFSPKTKRRKRKRKNSDDEDDEKTWSKEPIDIFKRPKFEPGKIIRDAQTPQRMIDKFATLFRLPQGGPFDEKAMERSLDDLRDRFHAHPLYSEDLVSEKYNANKKAQDEEKAQIKREFKHLALKWYMFQSLMQCLAMGSNWLMSNEWIPFKRVVHSSVFSGSGSSSSSLPLSESLPLELDSSSSSSSCGVVVVAS